MIMFYFNILIIFYPCMDLKDESTKDFDLTSHMLNHISRGSHSAPVWLYNLCSCGWMLLHAEPLEGSANRELCRGMASVATRRLASFLQLTFPIMPTQPASVFTTRVEEATGERRKVSEKEDNTVQKYSGALSLDESFNSLSVLSLFSDCRYLSTEVSTLSFFKKHFNQTHCIKCRNGSLSFFKKREETQEATKTSRL